MVVADGSNSRIGRVLGTTRRRELPLGMALRGYYRSDRHDDQFIESHLDIRDAEGNAVPGYGWIFPMGDGRVNVGVGLLSSEQRWKGLNTTHLMDAFVGYAPVSWGLSPETSCGPPTGGKLPMGLSVGPRAGGNVLIAGDASGAINPFNGEGIAYAYETGRLAASALGHALTGEGTEALLDYERELNAAYGPYYKVARAFVHMISHPEAMRLCVSLGMRSDVLMNTLLRIMANLMRPDAAGPAELGFRAMELVSRLAARPRPGREPGRLTLAHRRLKRRGAPLRRPPAATTPPPRPRSPRPGGPPPRPGPNGRAASSPSSRRAAPIRRTARRKVAIGSALTRPHMTSVRAKSAAEGPAAAVIQSITTQPSGPTSTLSGLRS